MADDSKAFFQEAWGDDGYYEPFSYGVGIDAVCQKALYPFFDSNKMALEIGSGGGTFTEKMMGRFNHLTCIDVIRKPKKFNSFYNYTYIELPSKSYNCTGVSKNSIDFAFCYNVFCHLPNDALKKYIASVNQVLRRSGDFVFMLSNIDRIIEPRKDCFKLGDCLPMGHYFQNEDTIDEIVDLTEWQIISRNMIPTHRDIIVHLKKIP